MPNKSINSSEISNKHSFMPTHYKMDKHTINQSQSATYVYLGITIMLNRPKTKIISEANATNAFLKHNITSAAAAAAVNLKNQYMYQ